MDVALGERVLASGSHRHVFWNQLDPRGGGLVPGLISAAIFCLPLHATVTAREKFSN